MTLERIEYLYHAVGQGLFSTGALFAAGDSGPRFRWAFDCGTVSGQALIERGFREISHPDPATLRFDLVAISHFDEDHISGLAALLARFPVGTLMLPYAPLAARLAMAFDQGVDLASPAFRLFVDPVGYILSLEGGERIERILLVPPSDDEGPPADDGGEPIAPGGGEGEPKLRVQIDTDRLDKHELDELLLGDAEHEEGRLVMLARAGRLRVARVWEFVPFNNAELSPPDLSAFAIAVGERRQALLDAADEWRRGGQPQNRIRPAIDALKAFYDASFGRGSAERNLISLFLYAGPLPALHAGGGTGGELFARDVYYHWDEPDTMRIAQLSTGDGYLDTPARLDDLIRYLSPVRVAQVSVCQVMHHGARRNWHEGVAARVSPLVSIFSSDPARGRTFHPHAEVLRDFWRYGAKQVDKHQGVSVVIFLY